MAIADQYLSKLAQPVWSDLSVQKAVQEGYKKSGWVYKSVRLISSAVSSVPWMVYDSEGEPIPEHPITILMTKPNPRISRQKLMELMVQWLQLCGNGYWLPVRVNGKTEELWPISPDRLRPIPTSDPAEWVKGYALDDGQSVKYEQDEIIHFLFPDPANPIIGIGPLQAAAKAVDVDVEQQNWQKSILDNKGTLDGVFSFKREFKTLDELTNITDKLNERFAGTKGKRIGAVGSEASYTRIAATPAELDALETRKFTREEIFVIFGIPPQLAGAQENSTYNNYSASELIFWMGTVVNQLDDIKDTLNFALKDELRDGETLGYDLSKVPAIRRAKLEQIKSGKYLSEMGVPVENINKILGLNIEEYEGWDKSFKAAPAAAPSEPSDDKEEERKIKLKIETRKSGEVEGDMREVEAIDKARAYEELLSEQKEAVFLALENGESIEAAIEAQGPAWIKTLTEHYEETSMKWAEEIVISTRGFEDEVAGAINTYLDEEAVILVEKSAIEAGTVSMITAQVADGLGQGLTIADLQQDILDAGTFSPERALRISRTVTGSAASVGQLTSGALSGATTKIWQASGFGVRKAHGDRNGERVDINGRFSIQLKSTVGPRFPGDPEISAGDRINCRCSLTFE